MRNSIVERVDQADEPQDDYGRWYARLFAGWPDPVLVCDVEQRVVYLNPAFTETFGWAAEELIGKAVDFAPEENRAEIVEAFEKLAREGRVDLLETHWLTQQGQLLTVELAATIMIGQDATIVGTMMSLRDITRRRQAQTSRPGPDDDSNRWLEEKIAQSLETNAILKAQIAVREQIDKRLSEERNLLRTLIDSLPDYIHINDTEGRTIIDNLAHRSLLGLTLPEEINGKTAFDFFPPALAARYVADDQAVMQSGQALINREEPTLDSEGNAKWLLTTKVPLRGEHGNVVGLVGINRDITDRKRAQEALQKAHDELERRVKERTLELWEANARLQEEIAERQALLLSEREAKREAQEANRMKDLFLATMSHELRTPLNAMIGFQHLMLFSDQLNEDNTHMAERTLANSQRLLSLINNILDLSRIASGRLEIIPVAMSPRKLAQAVCEDLALQAKEKGLTLAVEIDDKLPETIIHDEERITQIAINLVGNAVKFTETGAVRLSLKQRDSRLVIEVTDTGMGIPPSKQQIIFDDFVQLDQTSTRKHGGAGLGLSIVKRLVMLMGGGIKVSSDVGRGSTFTVELSLDLSTKK